MTTSSSGLFSSGPLKWIAQTREREVLDVTAVEEFTEVFRTEHRQIRDLLLELADAFRDRDTGRVRALIAPTASLRYYPL